MTAFGIIWLSVSFIALFKGADALALLLLLSNLFRPTCVYYSDFVTVSAMDVACLLFLLVFPLTCRRAGGLRIDARSGLLAAFCAWCVVGGTASLLMFDGYPIEEFGVVWGTATLAVEGVVSAGLTSSFWILLGRLALYGAAYFSLLCYASARPQCENRCLFRKFVYVSIAIVVPFGAIQMLHSMGVIDISWLMEVFHSKNHESGSAYWNNYKAIYSVFSEPSYCGPWLMSMGWCLVMDGRGMKGWLPMAAACFVEGVLTFSGSAFICFCIMAAVFAKRSLHVKVHYLVFAIVLICFVVFLPDVQKFLMTAANKLSSSSGVIRGACILQTWEVFLGTFGLGLGLHQVQCMDLLVGLMGQTGLIGAALFFAFLLACYRKTDATTSEGTFSRDFFLGNVSGLFFSCSGILYSGPLWLALYQSALMGGCAQADALPDSEGVGESAPLHSRCRSLAASKPPATRPIEGRVIS